VPVIPLRGVPGSHTAPHLGWFGTWWIVTPAVISLIFPHPADIKITNNTIIPMKERAVAPLRLLLRSWEPLGRKGERP
jgi:hypothetical protein